MPRSEETTYPDAGTGRAPLAPRADPEYADVRQTISREIVTWRPDMGDTDELAGRIVAMSMRDSTYGSYPVLTIDAGYPELVQVHALGSVFADELERQHITTGDVIAIKDLGTGVVKGGQWAGQSYRNVRVVKRVPVHRDDEPTTDE